MPTPTDHANVSLTLIAHEPITDINDTTTDVAKTVKRLYSVAVDAGLRAVHWNCATYRKTLAGLQAYDQNEWSFVYQLPQDPYCLKARRFEGEDNSISADRFNRRSTQFRVEGRFILTNVENPILIYTRRLTDVNLMDSLVYQAIAVLLGSHLALAIRQDYKRHGELFKAWELLRDEAAGLDEAEGQKDTFLSYDLLADR